MADENCPNCGHNIGIPGAFHGSPTMTMHTHRECPNCKRPPIWFKDGQEMPEEIAALLD
jgi:endogenous inhibitor of DNA gyrase (YacG/DUF329 family)